MRPWFLFLVSLPTILRTGEGTSSLPCATHTPWVLVSQLVTPAPSLSRKSPSSPHNHQQVFSPFPSPKALDASPQHWSFKVFIPLFMVCTSKPPQCRQVSFTPSQMPYTWWLLVTLLNPTIPMWSFTGTTYLNSLLSFWIVERRGCRLLT